MLDLDFVGIDEKEMRRRWDAHTEKLEKFQRRQLHKWCVLIGFTCFVLGVLSGMGIIWVNEHWTPIDLGTDAEVVEPEAPLLAD